MSRAEGFLPVLSLYFVTGLGSGASNVTVMGLIAHWFTRRYRGRAAGVIVCGSGLGIVLSGLLIPVILERFGAAGWRVGWLVLGGIVLVLTGACGLLLRNRPEERGLTPVGTTNDPATPPAEAGNDHGAPGCVVGKRPGAVDLQQVNQQPRINEVEFGGLHQPLPEVQMVRGQPVHDVEGLENGQPRPCGIVAHPTVVAQGRQVQQLPGPPRAQPQKPLEAFEVSNLLRIRRTSRSTKVAT